MWILGVTLAVLAGFVIRVCTSPAEPLDQGEIRSIRRLADRLRREQFQPFE